MTDKELVQSWMAFKELHRQGVVGTNIGPSVLKKAIQGGWWIFTANSFSKRILRSPEEFILGWGFGFDIWVWETGGLAKLTELPAMVAKRSGESDIESLFDSTEVARHVARLALARKLK